MKPQKTFISANSVKTNEERIDNKKVNLFIETFNTGIKSNRADLQNEDGSFSLNTGLDKIPYLNDNEFAYCVKLATNEGWHLSRFEDNYQTITYRMKKVK